MFSILFNNMNSFEDMGLKITTRPNIPIPQKRLKEYEIEGRNGTLTEDEETYKDIEIPISFHFIEKNDIYEKIERIKRWLLKIKDDRLLFSDTKYFYKVKYVRCNNIERSLKILGRFTVNFVCEPFLYTCSKDVFTEQQVVLNNNGETSEPLIKIYGSGNITLNVNDNCITLKDVNNYIIIDSEKQNAYNETELRNNKMIGNFPILQEGKNIITWAGNVTKVEIEPNWRWL